ncbi:MAG: HAMP domain-containing sensor histidine kinase [Actinomycetota bacterium]|nr:HAMP domain-containing sensor histidine kinase [Actinomycetota bacterium]
MPLFWRVFGINAALLLVATLLLLFSPVEVDAPIKPYQAAILVSGLVVMLVADLVLLWPSFAPLERLTRRMHHVDLLRPGQRISATGPREVRELIKAFNEMLARLESERRESGRLALQAQEEERLRIARGLHDEVGQTMTAVLLQLKRAADDAPPALRGELIEVQEAIRTSLDDVRRIARQLRPEMLEHLGLVSALTALATSFSERTGLAVERRFESELPRLDPDAELALYRIAQESLTNVARHADAESVQLELSRGPGSVVLRVADDGKGMNGVQPPGGGLRGMRERALMIGAALAVKQGPDGGVEVRLEVPAADAR